MCFECSGKVYLAHYASGGMWLRRVGSVGAGVEAAALPAPDMTTLVLDEVTTVNGEQPEAPFVTTVRRGDRGHVRDARHADQANDRNAPCDNDRHRANYYERDKSNPLSRDSKYQGAVNPLSN